MGDEFPEVEGDGAEEVREADRVGVLSGARGRSVMCIWWEDMGRDGQIGQNPNAD